MKLLRLVGDLTQLRREFRELSSESASEEEQAKYELTASARRFSRRTKRVVDDKLSFSATLMRAGEVHAANRLLEEVELDVRTEEAALIEKMNEVKVARASTRERMTRVRLGRMLAVSVAGSMLMAFSALGMAAAGFVQDREQDQIRRNAAAQRRALENAGDKRAAVAKLKAVDRNAFKLLRAGDVPVGALSSLTPAEIRRIGVLASGVDVDALQSFLVRVLPTPDLALGVVEKLAGRVEKVATGTEAPTVSIAAARVKKKAQRTAEDTQTGGSADEAEPSPTPEETEEPAQEEQTEERDGRRHETGGGGDGDDDPGGSGSLPGDGEELLGDD